ncbi:recF protein [Halobacteroides halobius DSM 5150]|uniref:DNA replication and repair protein RecF n=1 Tax=Halobacteroides halobius (strain ATCC 35273 / DSM 5150 / MD-1) TaxID=748449 RepID=L0K426_HALHC|nr:DNA replication/repair protein RecF [Halobacteroides halobius]AGB40042.1 recF protein [Halobacteroides halobius DSM 5150]
MKLSQLYLNKFRNYKQQHLEFNSHLNLFIGDNAQGKTNLLEAIYLLGTGSSHRTNVTSELANWEDKKFYAKGEVLTASQDYQLTVSLKGRQKEVKVNSNKLDRITDLIGYLNVVIFSPEDLKLIKGSPSLRRKFINLELAQVNSYYNHLLKDYRKVLKQRNNLLKEIRDNGAPAAMLEVWNQQLIDLGAKVIKRRLEALKKLIPLARLKQRKLTGGAETLELKYDTKLKIGHESSVDVIKKEFESYLIQQQQKEIARGVTTIGPHRDDISLIVNNIDIRKFGSQGQQRTTALALKLSELEFMKSETGEYPVLLLDDVFSELDNKRCAQLLNTVRDKIQTFITSTNQRELNSEKVGINDYNLYKINNGKAIEV